MASTGFTQTCLKACRRAGARYRVNPEEDEGGAAWAAGVSSEWAGELIDAAQDIYNLSDGQPIDAAG